MSNLVTKNSNKLEEILELYKYLSVKLNTEHLDNKQFNTIQYKLNILDENLCTIHENIEDIISDLGSIQFTKDFDDRIKYREKVNNICSEFYPLIIMKILSQNNI
mgnify:FL=1|tara:strand:+ start:1926 stop:2240 length:315 start_codon:yes stop_codon:yes gene_type:complete